MTATNERPNLNETLIALRAGTCNLIYVKLTGETRVAVGTLNLDFISKDKWPKNVTAQHNQTEEEKNPDLVHYYDLTVNGWRCFWLENLKCLSLRVEG
jgi:hypothetical protein